MQKIAVVFGVLAIMLVSCGKDQKETTAADDGQEILYDYRKLADRNAINDNAVEILNEWEAFQDFSRSFEIFYQARNEEDLILAVDDLIEKEKNLEASEYPELFDKFEIKSRQRVIKTFLLKTKADLEGNRNPTQSAVTTAEAYNIFREQFNIITSNPIDTQQLIDES